MDKHINLTPEIGIKVSQKSRHKQAYKSHTRNRNQSLTSRVDMSKHRNPILRSFIKKHRNLTLTEMNIIRKIGMNKVVDFEHLQQY